MSKHTYNDEKGVCVEIKERVRTLSHASGSPSSL